MERNIIFLLLSAVTFTLSQDFLGYPMITLNCTTDYTVQSRSIHVSWLLNSTPPGNIMDDRGKSRRVQNCETVLICENGYESRFESCNDVTLRDGWNFNNILLSETICNVTVKYDDRDDFENIMYISTEMCSFLDSIETTVDIYDNTMQNLTLGNPYEIQCEVYTDQVVHSDIVNITWIGPDNDTVVNDSRIIVTTTNSIGNNHISTLQFLYLKEGDEGLYTCHVTILSNTDSESFELETILIPTPNLSISIPNNLTVGSELSLKCDVTTVKRGLTSTVETVWITGDTAVEELNNSRISISSTKLTGNMYTSSLHFSYLSEDDNGSLYICSVAIAGNTITSGLIELNSFYLTSPAVNVTALSQNTGNLLSLRCDVNIVRGITSGAEVVWKINNTEIQRYNGNITEGKTSYTYYYNTDMNLNVNDNNSVYQCEVIINTLPLISNADNFTLHLSVLPTIAPNHLSSDSTSPGSAVIAVISVVIAMVTFMAFGIFIGIYIYNKNKRSKRIQWARDEDIKYLPPIDDTPYSVIGKEAPSTCESFGNNYKAMDWTKDIEMPCIDEECDLITADPVIDEQQMLDQLCGHNTSRMTRSDKFSVSTADSGIDTKLDSDLDKSLQTQTESYISHQVAEDMYSEQDETELPSPQKGYNLHNSQTADNSPNSTSSQTVDNSTLLSKFYNALMKQNSISENDCDAEGSKPTVGSIKLHSASNLSQSSTNEGNNYDHTVAHNRGNTSQSLSYSANLGIAKTVEESNYVFAQDSALDTNQPLLHSVQSNNSATSGNGVQVGCYVTSSTSENASQPLLHSSGIDTTTATIENGSYTDNFTALNTNQPPSHSIHSDAVLTGSYIDRYTASNANHPTSQPTYSSTVITGCYVDYHTTSSTTQPVLDTITLKGEGHVNHCAISNSNHPTSHLTRNHTVSTGAYVDYPTSNSTPALTYPKIATAKDRNHVVNNAASDGNQPTAYNGNIYTVPTGSYVDRYSASTTSQPWSHFNYTDAAMTAKEESDGDCYNSNQHSLQSTVMEGIYIDHYIASSNNDHGKLLPLHSTSTSTTVIKGGYTQHCATPNTSHPFADSADVDTTAIGSYVDCSIASSNNSNSVSAKAPEKSSTKLSSEKELSSSNSSYTAERSLSPSSITGVYLPYTASACSTVNKPLTTSVPSLPKRKPGDLFLPSVNTFSYSLLNEKSSCGSSSTDDCDTPNVGEYIAHDDLENLGLINNYKVKIGSNHFVSSPAAPYSTSSYSATTSGYVDYKTAIQQAGDSKAASAQQVKPQMQQNANVNLTNTALMQNTNGYMTESSV